MTGRSGFRRARLTAAAALLAIGVGLGPGLGGCGSSDTSPVVSPTAPAPPSGSSAPAAVADLSKVLIQPSGFVAMNPDPISGPIGGIGDVRRIFTDHPDDPTYIVKHGFVRGYIRAWQESHDASEYSDPLAEIHSVTVLALVMQLETAENAKAIVAHFRAKNLEDGYQVFAVPSELPDGYGTYVKQGEQVFTHMYGVSWTCGRYTFDLMVSYDAQSSAETAISLALAQHSASCPALRG